MKMQLSASLLCGIITVLTINYVSSSKLLFFLVDGFRWDYFKISNLRLNGFARLFRGGSRAEWLTPEFPTNSFPNYKTLETGKLGFKVHHILPTRFIRLGFASCM